MISSRVVKLLDVGVVCKFGLVGAMFRVGVLICGVPAKILSRACSLDRSVSFCRLVISWLILSCWVLFGAYPKLISVFSPLEMLTLVISFLFLLTVPSEVMSFWLFSIVSSFHTSVVIWFPMFIITLNEMEVEIARAKKFVRCAETNI